VSSRHGPESEQRRRLLRVQAELSVVIASEDGSKHPARVIDLSTGGMHLACSSVPEYGARITVVVQLQQENWALLSATVRWFTKAGFGVAFDQLNPNQAQALAAFMDQVAA
jgi:c-di-GMP-binding flagellar brake protein YcgR